MAVSRTSPRTVVIAVFSAPPVVGWVLYYSGFNRAPVISKYGSGKVTTTALATDALVYLAQDLNGDSEEVGVRVINASNGAPVEGIKPLLLAPFIVRDKPAYGEDVDVLSYLFTKAPHQVLRPQRARSPLPVAGPVPVPVSAETVVAAADASYKTALDNGGVPEAGTGWVIEYQDESADTIMETGSRHYEDGEQDYAVSVNALEVCALRDALQHLSSLLDEKLSGTSRIILYSDSTFAVRAIMDRNLTRPVSEVLEEIHGIISCFSSKGVTVEYLWTKGHADNRWNLMAHKMADIGRAG